ncbi:hypothetical protein BRC72_07265 [Halobacteriales archaeon QH_7_66_36]|nr:MAG: hypothetical protein BRC72_07265 [Halobacteriales archaeon QH_7_66_36]
METQGSDRRIGLSMLFGVLGLLGAGVMLAASLTEQQVASGWGFAVAMLAGTLLIVALQVYD